MAAVAMLLASVALTDNAEAADPALPDLGIAPIPASSVKIEKIQFSDGKTHRVLRFTSEVVNVGAAAFEVRGSRATTADQMTGQQYVGGAPAGGPVEFVYAGDGHNHWHVKKLANYVLRSTDGKRSKTGDKVGFCFWDGAQYRNPAPAFYGPSGCGTTSTLELTMGLSPGWGDIYPSSIAYQWVDITGMSRGNYRLTVTADALGQFTEANEANNSTWIDVKIGRGTKVSVLAVGPGA